MEDDRAAPATKSDIQELRSELKALEDRLNEHHQILRSEMQHTFDELRETIHDGQTALLKAFFDFAQTNQNG